MNHSVVKIESERTCGWCFLSEMFFRQNCVSKYFEILTRTNSQNLKIFRHAILIKNSRSKKRRSTNRSLSILTTEWFVTFYTVDRFAQFVSECVDYIHTARSRCTMNSQAVHRGRNVNLMINEQMASKSLKIARNEHWNHPQLLK